MQELSILNLEVEKKNGAYDDIFFLRYFSNFRLVRTDYFKNLYSTQGLIDLKFILEFLNFQYLTNLPKYLVTAIPLKITLAYPHFLETLRFRWRFHLNFHDNKKNCYFLFLAHKAKHPSHDYQHSKADLKLTTPLGLF